ncbi:MAG: sulfur carrier protein ThiS [Spirochaetales bacterium]|nr:sulfur carrier protein ThiS [Spirochaetales bacterium]
MNLVINGKKEEFSREVFTIVELLEEKRVESPDMVSVQVNGEILNRNDFPTSEVKEGDEVDFLYFMGGGSL